MPAVLAYLSMPRDLRARDASGRRLQSTCQRRAPVVSRGVRIRDRGFPRPHRRTVRAHRDRPLWPEFRRPSRSFIPAWACHGTRSADASVTDPSFAEPKPADPYRPRSFLPPLNVMSFGLPDPRHLPSTEEPSSDPFPTPDSAFHRVSVHERRFARGGCWPPEARLRPRPPAATGGRFLNQASPIDFCYLRETRARPRTRNPHDVPNAFTSFRLPNRGRATSAVSGPTPKLQLAFYRPGGPG